MWKRTAFVLPILLATTLLVGVCAPEGEEPTTVYLPVVTDGANIEPATNAEGWTVTLEALRVAVRDVTFTIEGEAHADLGPTFRELLIPEAHAHPGHLAGGDVTGELSGTFILDLFQEPPESLGEAALLEGAYQGMNLYFRTADESDGLDEDDPLLGHTAYLAGTAEREDRVIAFTAVLDTLADNTRMIGAPFSFTVTETTEATLGITVYTIDPSEGDTLFDGLDFGALADETDTVAIVPGDPAHNILMKTLERHDHYGVSAK